MYISEDKIRSRDDRIAEKGRAEMTELWTVRLLSGYRRLDKQNGWITRV